jgi:hypothetical protein
VRGDRTLHQAQKENQEEILELEPGHENLCIRLAFASPRQIRRDCGIHRHCRSQLAVCLHRDLPRPAIGQMD